MNVVTAILDFVILVVVALVPAVGYLAWVKRSERFSPEPWRTLLGPFAYGAFFATVIAGILEAILVGVGTAASQAIPAPEFTFLNGNSTAGEFFLILVIAPFIEEALKGSGVYAYRAQLRGPADGPVFGASVGLGFGFFETLLYGVGAFAVGGLVAGIALIAIRSVSSVLLHGASTGIFGYGFARSRFHLPGPGTGSYYLVAVGMHAAFNALASLAAIVAIFGITGVTITLATWIGLVAAIAFVFLAIEHVRELIQASSYPAIALGSARYQPKGGARPAAAPVRKK